MNPTQDVRLYISVPSNRDWKGKFGASIAMLTHYLTQNGINVPGYRLTDYFLRCWGNSSCLSIARQNFVDEMTAGGYTHWLSLDDDMTFPMAMVDRLIARGKDVISVNARHKTDTIIGSLQDLNGVPLNSTGKSGVEELKTMGGAIFLARIDAFGHIPRPHFQVLWSEEHNSYVGEDVYFATLLRVNGVRLWCDHDASQHVTHIGDFEYGWPRAAAPAMLENDFNALVQGARNEQTHHEAA